MKTLIKELFVEGDPIAWICTFAMVLILVGLVGIVINGGK